MKAFCVFSLESPYPGNPKVYTKYTIYNRKKKITLNLQLWDFFQGTYEQAISVPATEGLL